MSRPHGAASARQPERIVKASATFKEARKALVSTLENLSFVKVVSVQAIPGRPYTGEAIETHWRDAREKPKLVFFDKTGRTRGLLKIGPIQVAQAPMGVEHPSAVPTVGDVLVGSLVPNTRKSHLEHVLRGWSSDAKPLWELLRILKFGTKASEFEARSMLIQATANLMQASAEVKKTRDDIYMTARIILWSSIRQMQVLASIQKPSVFFLTEAASQVELDQAATIRLSCSASEFIDGLALKFNDSEITDAFQLGLVVTPEPPAYSVPYSVPYSAPSLSAPAYIAPVAPQEGPYSWITAYASQPVPQPASPFVMPAALRAAAGYDSPKTPMYAPSSPIEQNRPTTPPYSSESPKGSPIITFDDSEL